VRRAGSQDLGRAARRSAYLLPGRPKSTPITRKVKGRTTFWRGWARPTQPTHAPPPPPIGLLACAGGGQGGGAQRAGRLFPTTAMLFFWGGPCHPREEGRLLRW
jgi:hypothetical protein